MTDFPWRIFRNGSEIVFPEGARRFVSVDVRPIPHSGAVERTLDGGAVWTGDPAFRLHEVQLSCSDQTLAPIFDLWPGQVVAIELPTEFSVPGPSAVLPHDPVAGSVYGVNAADDEVGRRAGAGRSVSVSGAAAIRYRPRLECIVADRQADSTHRRGQSGWSLTLEEIGAAYADEDDIDFVKIAALPLQTIAAGSDLVIDSGDLTSTNTGKPVLYSLDTALPGLSISAAGLLTWDDVPAGTYALGVVASSGSATAAQTIAVLSQNDGGVPWAVLSGGTIHDYTDEDGKSWRAHDFTETQMAEVLSAGLAEIVLIGAGGGGARHDHSANSTGGAGGGQVFKTPAPVFLNIGTSVVEIGAGGDGRTVNTTGVPGSKTSAFGFVAIAGGGGGTLADGPQHAYANGGGAGAVSNAASRGAVGAVNLPGGGNRGGSSVSGTYHIGGGGAGAGGVGATPNGGPGLTIHMLADPIDVGGGGGGARRSGGGSGGVATHGGGNGATGASGVAQNGEANTGGGGGGGTIPKGGNGGSGRVIVRVRRQ